MLQQSLDKISDFFLPRLCLLCANKTESTLNLCQPCLADLPYITQACKRCGLPLKVHHQACGRCLRSPPIFDATYAIFSYELPISYLITACKFKHKLIYARLLGQLMARSLAQKLALIPDLLVPIPLHRQRLVQRGYNQALEIARPLSQTLRIPIDYRCCKRIKATQAQTGLPSKKRRQNIKNAFDLCGDMRANNIALVDDVMTTGSTANELSKIFKCYGVNHIQVWCCARTLV